MKDKILATAIVISCLTACNNGSDEKEIIAQYKNYCSSPPELRANFFSNKFVRSLFQEILNDSDENLLQTIKVTRTQLNRCERFGIPKKFEFRSGEFKYLTIHFDVGRDNLENKIELSYTFEDGAWLIAETRLFGPPNLP